MHVCHPQRNRFAIKLGSCCVKPPQKCAVFNHTFTSGFTIVEMIGALTIVGIMVSIVVPVFLIVARERHATEQRQFALQHASNLLEQPVTRPWSELEPGELNLPDASADLASLLPKLERKLVVRDVDGSIPTRQLTISIRWQDRAGQMVAPIQISTFVFRSKEDAP